MERMNFKIMLTAGLALALAGCTTVAEMPTVTKKNAVETRWEGKPAGQFFAKFGPPINDVQSGSSTVYTWRGGFKTRRIGGDAAKGKAARTQYLSCQVDLNVSSDYVIQGVKIVADRQLDGGKSWCEEFLGGE
jgi:hypothetical protein